MKNPLKYALLLLAAIIIGASICGARYYYHNYVEQVRGYYIIYIDLPRVVRGTYRNRVQGGKVDIKKLGRYPNDSTAIASETKRSEEFDEYLIKEIEKHLQKQREVEQDFVEYSKERAHVEANTELLEQSRILMRISHIRKYNKAQVKSLSKSIIKNGVFSEEVRRYIEKYKLDAEFYTIK